MSDIRRYDGLKGTSAESMEADLDSFDDPLAGLLVCPPEMRELVRFPVWGSPTFRSLSNGSMAVTFTVPSQFKTEVVQLNDRPGLVVWVSVLVPPNPFEDPTNE